MAKRITMSAEVKAEKKTARGGFMEFLLNSKAKNSSLRTIEYDKDGYERFQSFLDIKGITLLSEIVPKVIQKYTLRFEILISIHSYIRAVRRSCITV